MDSLLYYAQVLIGDELWVSNIRFNGLYRIEISSGNAVFVGRFPHHNWDYEELHMFAKRYGDKIYFFPKKSEGIDIYDLKKGIFTYVQCEADRDNGYATVIDSFYSNEDKGSIIVVSCYQKTPLQELSLKKEEFVRKIELKKSNICVKNESNTRALYACKMQDEIFFPIHGTNKVGSYRLSTKKEEVYSIERLKRIQGDIVFDGRDLWINADRGIYQWNPYEKKLKFVCDCSSEKEGWIEQFLLYDQVMICIPRWLNHIKIIDRQNFGQREVIIDRSVLSKKNDIPWRDVRESIIWKNTLIICPVKYKETVCVNLENYEVSYKKWGFLETLPTKDVFFTHEKREEDLQVYIRMIGNNEKSYYKRERNNIGHSILQYIETSD